LVSSSSRVYSAQVIVSASGGAGTAGFGVPVRRGSLGNSGALRGDVVVGVVVVDSGGPGSVVMATVPPVTWVQAVVSPAARATSRPVIAAARDFMPVTTTVAVPASCPAA